MLLRSRGIEPIIAVVILVTITTTDNKNEVTIGPDWKAV